MQSTILPIAPKNTLCGGKTPQNSLTARFGRSGDVGADAVPTPNSNPEAPD